VQEVDPAPTLWPDERAEPSHIIPVVRDWDNRKMVQVARLQVLRKAAWSHLIVLD
jgi:hypothetical protein